MRGRSIISSPGGVPLLGWGRIRDNLYRVHRVSLSDGGYRAACGAAMVDTVRRAEQGCSAKGVAIWGKEVYDRGAKLHKVHWKVGKEQR